MNELELLRALQAERNQLENEKKTLRALHAEQERKLFAKNHEQLKELEKEILEITQQINKILES
jgi:DNA repair exonuclease SbcCD ATPase subunit